MSPSSTATISGQPGPQTEFLRTSADICIYGGAAVGGKTVGLKHLQGSAAGVDLIIMGEIREPFENAKQVFVPGAAQDLHVAGAALRTKRPEPRELVTTLRARCHGEATERPDQMLCLALTGLPRILAKPDADSLAVLCSGIEQQFFDVARVRPPAHHIQEPVAAISVAAELDADRPIGIVELVLFGRREIPIADHIEIGRG